METSNIRTHSEKWLNAFRKLSEQETLLMALAAIIFISTWIPNDLVYYQIVAFTGWGLVLFMLPFVKQAILH